MIIDTIISIISPINPYKSPLSHYNDQHSLHGKNMFLPKVQAGKRHETHRRMSLAHGAQSLYAMASEAVEKICFNSRCRWCRKNKRPVSLERCLGASSTGNKHEHPRHPRKFRERSFVVDYSVRPHQWCCRTSTALLASRPLLAFPLSSDGSSTRHHSTMPSLGGNVQTFAQTPSRN